MTASGRANGKVILLGEHAVVHGAPALAAGIDRGARATASPVASGPSRLVVLGRAIVADPAADDDLARAFAALLAPGDASARAAPAVAVDAASDLPPGGGLGSSAALAVAIARAVCAIAGGGEDDVLARAAAWERVFHGNPSGVDTAAAARGGCLRFVRGVGAVDVPLGADLALCVGWSGQSSSTRAMVEAVAALRAREPSRFAAALAAITSLVEAAERAIVAGDLASLGAAMDDNQAILAGFGVSTGAIDRLCADARRAGALGAKLTGGGGGGSVIALARAEAGAADAVLAAWRAAGYDGFATRVRRGEVEAR